MTVAKQVEDKAEITIQEELEQLLAKKTFTKTEMNRIREIEKTIQAEKFESEKIAALDNQSRKASSSIIRSTKVIEKGVGAGITIISH